MELDPDYPVTDELYGETFFDKWEGSKFIWNYADLVYENEERMSNEQI